MTTEELVSNKIQNPETVKYSPEEEEYRLMLIKRATDARNQREDNHIEFDDCNYTKYYDTNYKTGNAYIRRKKNREDSRIVTGTTLEKENTFLSQVLNYNFEPNIEVFDKEDLPLMRLGDKIESLVKKSRQLEHYESKRPLYYKEGADQGTWFAEECWLEEWEIQKTLQNIDYSNLKVDEIKWKTKKKRKIIGAQSNLIPGTGVYLGNVKQFFMKRQPFAFTRDYIPYTEAKAKYGGYDRFKFVPQRVVRVMSDDGSVVRGWTLEECEENFVEVLKYYDPYANEYQLMLNDVMMLPVGFPLTVISPSGVIPIAKGDIEPISEFFAYSKSYPAKTKVAQEILDDTIRTMVLRLRQMMEPPKANNTGTVLSRKIFYPGNITDDLNPALLQDIIPNNQIGAGEFQVFGMIKQIVNEMTMNPIMSGQNPGGKQTATQVLQEKQQSLMKLGYAIYGILAFERDLTWLRIYNLLANLTKPIDERIDEVTEELTEVYSTMTIKEKDEQGEYLRVIDFNEEGVAKMPEQLDAEAQIMSTPELPVQKVYMNPKMIQSQFLTWKFYIDITPTPKETSELQTAIFTENIMKAKQLFGPQATNDEYLKGRFAVMNKEDPQKYWAKQQQLPPELLAQLGGGGQPQTPINDQLLQGVSKPSINALTHQ